MSEWIPVSDKSIPLNAKVLVTLVNSLGESKVETCRNDGLSIFIDWRITHWMPIPKPYENPNPVFEVPKDGRTYLCWHKVEGSIQIYWTENPNSSDGYTSRERRQDSCYFLRYDLLDIIRYMDSEGVWHERET